MNAWPKDKLEYSDVLEALNLDRPRRIRYAPIDRAFALKIAESRAISNCVDTIFATRGFSLTQKTAELVDGKWRVTFTSECRFIDGLGDGTKFETSRSGESTYLIDAETGEFIGVVPKAMP